jgi:hypothetical protein
MLRDPVTREINVNPKNQPKKEKETVKTSNAIEKKISKQDKFSDLRPLNKFCSKLLGSGRRLTVSPSVLYMTKSSSKVPMGRFGVEVFL